MSRCFQWRWLRWMSVSEKEMSSEAIFNRCHVIVTRQSPPQKLIKQSSCHVGGITMTAVALTDS